MDREPTGTGGSTESAVAIATACAGVMIAMQVAAKATSDGLFLSTFDITSLPQMVIGASIISMGVVLGSARLMSIMGPGRLVPALFGLSSVLLIGEWLLSRYSARAAAVALFLHMSVLGLVLISGFWSVVNERFDPRTAKLSISKIGGGATFGGLVGGITAERVAATFSVTAMLPVLALMHAICGVLVYVLAQSGDGPVTQPKDEGPTRSGLAIVRERPYMRNLALLAALSTISAGLVEYVFKAHAVTTYASGEELMRFFALFYTAIGLVTFGVQTTVGRPILEKLGLANAAATLPGSIAIGSIAALVFPSLASIALARGAESVVRSSTYRSGYELFYTPVPTSAKRATKPIIDVAFKRLGDAVGGGIVALMILIIPQHVNPVLLVLAILLSPLGVWICRRLADGYVQELESSLRDRAVELDMVDLSETMTRHTVLRTIGALDVEEIRRQANLQLGAQAHELLSSMSVPAARLLNESDSNKADVAPAAARPSDPLIARITDLRSGEAERVKKALATDRPLSQAEAAHVIPLLAWDEVSDLAIDALRKVAPSIVGQLLDSMLDPQEEFTIRRRLPRVVFHAKTQRAVDGLLLGLEDKRFEVRFQCGRALAILRRKVGALVFDKHTAFGAVEREVAVDRRVWESQRLLDESSDDVDESFVDEFLRDRSRRSLQHVFTLLSLVLEPEPLQIAFRGLHTSDRTLRGTALEYLESVLPEKLRKSLWPFLEVPPESAAARKTRDEILAQLIQSNASIQLNLSELRKKHGS